MLKPVPTVPFPKTMKSTYFSLLVAVSASVLWTGCASPARRIETGGRDSITTVDQIDIQDFIVAAEASVNKLLASGALDRVPAPPAILAVNPVRNDTGHQFDSDLLTKKIRVKLNTSGKALTSTTVGLNGKAEDALAKGLQSEREFLEDKKVTRPPDFSLSGKILETRAKAGNVKQSTFSFQLSLTDNRGLALWEGEEEITKQGKRATVGF
jgi:PBP1b-binding outer membrane lipoprotein LpoB